MPDESNVDLAQDYILGHKAIHPSQELIPHIQVDIRLFMAPVNVFFTNLTFLHQKKARIGFPPVTDSAPTPVSGTGGAVHSPTVR